MIGRKVSAVGYVVLALLLRAPSDRGAPLTLIVGTSAHVDLASLLPNHRTNVAGLRVRLVPDANGLVVTGGRLTGTPRHPGEMTAVISTPDVNSVIARVPIVVFAADLPTPLLPDSLFGYADSRNPLPRHFLSDASGLAITEDNTPGANRTTDAGATLGRVLFYDTRLSVNDRIACASCHQQQFGFADSARFSRGVAGTPTARHAMALANARFYRSGHFFRDDRAPTLESQVLQPIENPVEMGLRLDALLLKVRATPYYPPLFLAAFGTDEISAERVAAALAQFVRSLTSTGARLDSMYRGGGPPNTSLLTAAELAGRRLFLGRAACTRCHRTNALNLDLPDNIGLDAIDADSGAGGGRFKVASLRNVAIRPPYMHDGRFQTLDEVVAFYDSGIRDNPHLDPRLRSPDGTPQRLHLTDADRTALVAYLNTFTDQQFLHDVRFADPFRRESAGH